MIDCGSLDCEVLAFACRSSVPGRAAKVVVLGLVSSKTPALESADVLAPQQESAKLALVARAT